MVDLAAVKRLALSLPEAEGGDQPGQIAFTVCGKGFAWTYMQRVEPKKPRVARPDVLAVRCPMASKEMLIEAAPGRFFDDDHYRGFPAVLVRLEAIDEAELLGLLWGGWRAVAPWALVRRVDGG